MNLDDARLLSPLLRQIADRLDIDLTPDAPPTPLCSTPAEFEAAYSSGAPKILLAPSFVYPAHLTIGRPVDLIGGASTFLDGIDVKAPNVNLSGLLIKRVNSLTDIMQVTAPHCSIDACTFLGDPVKGAKRGIAANGPYFSLTNSLIDNCFQTYPGNDSQAIIVWDNPGPVNITGNTLYAGSETILFGGADPSSEANIPSDITIKGNLISARPEWQPLLIGIKSRLEIKCARRVLIQGNRIEYCWGKHGQDGYLLTLNVRNQGNKAPFSTIEDITVVDNDFAHGAAAINILGQDNINPSQRMSRVSITGNRFTDLDAVKYAGNVAKMIILAGGASNLTIDNNTFAGVGLSSALYFNNGTYDNLSVQGNTFPKTKYKYFGNVAGTNFAAILATYVTSGTVAGNTEV